MRWSQLDNLHQPAEGNPEAYLRSAAWPVNRCKLQASIAYYASRPHMTGITSIAIEQVHMYIGRAVSRNAHTVSSGLEF